MFYNLFLHPLRKYPGPFLAGSTRAYYLFYDVRGLSHWKVNEWHQKYGPVIRIAPDELSCALESRCCCSHKENHHINNIVLRIADTRQQTRTARPGRPSTASPTRRAAATSRRTRSGGTRPSRASSTSSTPTTRATAACAACRTRPSATRLCARRSRSSAATRRCSSTSCTGCAAAVAVLSWT